MIVITTNVEGSVSLSIPAEKWDAMSIVERNAAMTACEDKITPSLIRLHTTVRLTDKNGLIVSRKREMS